MVSVTGHLDVNMADIRNAKSLPVGEACKKLAGVCVCVCVCVCVHVYVYVFVHVCVWGGWGVGGCVMYVCLLHSFRFLGH